MVMRVFRLRTGLRPTLGLDELIDLRPSETAMSSLASMKFSGLLHHSRQLVYPAATIKSVQAKS